MALAPGDEFAGKEAADALVNPAARPDSTRSVLLIAAVALLGAVALTVAVVMFSKPRPVEAPGGAAGVGVTAPDGAPATPASACGCTARTNGLTKSPPTSSSATCVRPSPKRR